MKYLFAIALLLASEMLFSQKDNPIHSYPSLSQGPGVDSYVIEMGASGYAIIKGNHFEVVLIDKEGAIRSQFYTDSLDGLQILYSDIARYDEASDLLYIFSGARDKNNGYYLSIVFSPQLSEAHIVDAITLPKDVFPTIKKFKWNSARKKYESFGTLYNSKTRGLPYGIIYFTLDSTHQFENIHYLEDFEVRMPLLDFQWIERRQGWLTSLYTTNIVFIDSSFSVHKFKRPENENGDCSYVDDDNITHTFGSPQLVRSIYADESGQSDVILYESYPYHNVPEEKPINPTCMYLIAKANVHEDSLEIIDATFLNTIPNGFVPHSQSQMLIDSKGNYLIVGINPLKLDVPTTLGIVKISPGLKHLWEATYYDGHTTFFPFGLNIDSDNNLLIVGRAIGLHSPHVDDGFFLKVYEDGSLNSTRTPKPGYDFSVSPNPASGIVFIRGTKGVRGAVFRLYDGLGKPALSAKLTSSQVEISLHRIPQGLYYWSISGRPDEPAQSGKLVVRR